MKATFAELTGKQIDYIEGAEFDRMIVTKSDIAEATEALELDGKTFEELTAIRNAVVRHLADLKGAKRDAGDWVEFDRLSLSRRGPRGASNPRTARNTDREEEP